MTHTFQLDQHEAFIHDAEAEWIALNDAVLSCWKADIKTMIAEQQTSLSAGRWVSGSTDLLNIIGRGRWETYHCAMLAWLMKPDGRHRLGEAFLRKVLDACVQDLNIDFDDFTAFVPATEVNGPTSRADILVNGPGLHLVIEVKVDAAEGDMQCQRLYNDHARPDARFIFLTPRGRNPRSCDKVTQKSWTTLSFRWVKSTLEELLKDNAARVEQEPDASATLRTYLTTLREEFP